MATIEIYDRQGSKAEIYLCSCCGFNMTVLGFCRDCNRYDTAMTLAEYLEFNQKYPKLRVVK